MKESILYIIQIMSTQSSSDGLFDSGLDLPNINANVDQHNDNSGGDFMRHKPLKIKRVLTQNRRKECY